MPRLSSPTDGTTIAYDVAGSGPPVVMLHGSALSKAIWRGLGYVAALQDEFTVVRVDLRGHGTSGKPHDAGAYRMETLTGDVVSVMDDLELPEAHLVGYSMGARVGFALAAAAPERATSLTSLGGTYRSQAGQIEKVFFPGYLHALRTGGMQAFIDGQQRDGSDLGSATRTAFLANDPEAMAAYFEQSETEPGLGEDILESMTLPTLLMAGTADRPRHDDSERASKLMPNAHFVPLPERGHGNTLFPAGPVLAELLPFLRHGGRE
ncbi:alpha/beta fold hydrolase [Arthrobacter castelli]|uniref:alpha/beta fold hydrolase n=1 Tax=Arthrobacter castelli TaxID=271431 RepID=UPI00040C13DA|nr:alpha/beta hydrolase [Arthrobacter castelli]